MNNKETKTNINITPHKSLMLKIGQTGYSTQEALSELIDNAIDARIRGVMLHVDVTVTPERIVVQDDGKGMSREEAEKSIRLGFSHKVQQLGEFGLGLKSASTFLGKKFILTTTGKNNPELYRIVFNEDEWMKEGQWDSFPFYVGTSTPEDLGTSISIEQLKVQVNDHLLNILKQELGMRFGPFVKNRELELTLNGGVCQDIARSMVSEPNHFEINKGAYTVKGWWSYQLLGLNKGYFGFHTFRRGRLVTTYDKIGLNPNQDIKQIIGEIEIDGVEISHNKKTWQKDTQGYKEVEHMVRNYINDYEPNPRKILSGYPASGGIVEGVVRKINMFMGSNIEEEMKKVAHGDILVTEMTRPQFLLAIRRSGAIITDMGGNLSHAAIMAREFNIPAVIGTQTATKILQDGQRVIVDGTKGIVYET